MILTLAKQAQFVKLFSELLKSKGIVSQDDIAAPTRTVQSGGSEWVTSQTYDAEGRLVKTASDKLGEPGTESVYAYDEAGRLLSITNSPKKGNRTDFRYDEQGRKTTIQRGKVDFSSFRLPHLPGG
jgi:YD repeat-containing protein